MGLMVKISDSNEIVRASPGGHAFKVCTTEKSATKS